MYKSCASCVWFDRISLCCRDARCNEEGAHSLLVLCAQLLEFTHREMQSAIQRGRLDGLILTGKKG